MKWLKWISRAGYFLLFYIKEVIVSNFQVAYDVLTPRHRSSPAIIAVPVENLNDRQIAALANLITMTPGTLTLDLEGEDKRYLSIHDMFARNPDESVDQLVKGYRERIRHVF